MSKNFFGSFDTNYTEMLSKYAVQLEYKDLPEEVIDRIKIITLHTLGVSLAASSMEQANSSIRLAKINNGGIGGNSSIWIGGEKLSMVNAVFANATTADLLDWEDCSWTGHPSAGVIPAAFAVAEEFQSSGKKFIESIATGFEVYQRIAMAVQPPSDFDHKQGWGLVSWQIFASAATASKLMDLDEEKTNQAYGMACLYTIIPSNLMQATMSNAYHYMHGLAAQNGIMAALSAREGVDNLQDCFDIPYAYIEHFTTADNKKWFLEGLGKEYLLMDILIKHWPANMWIQTPIEIVHDIVKENKLNPMDIKEIIVNPPTQYRMHYNKNGFSSIMDAQFSMPYAISAMLLEEKVGADWYAKEKLADKKILELAGRIQSGKDKEDTLTGSFEMFKNRKHPLKNVKIIMNNGKIYEKTMSIHKGHPDNMFTWDETCNLFRNNASMLSKEKTEKIIDFIYNIENVENISKINDLLKLN